MIEYLYTCDFDDKGADLKDEAMSLNVMVYRLAGQYLYQPLQDLAASKFTEHANAHWDHPMFDAAIAQVYDHASTDQDALKKTLIAVTKKHASTLFGDAEQYPQFLQVARETPHFAADVGVKCFTQASESKVKWYKCYRQGCRYNDISGFCAPDDVPSNNNIWCPGCGTANLPSTWNQYEVKGIR